MLALAQDFIRSLDDLSIERSSIEDLMKRFSVKILKISGNKISKITEIILFCVRQKKCH